MAEDSQNATFAKAAALWVQGRTKTEIGEALGVCRQTVTNWFSTADMQEEIAALQQGQREAAKRAGASLLGKVAKVWDGALTATSGHLCADCGATMPDHAIRLRAADSVADRFGIPKTEVQEVVASLTMADKDDAAIETEVLAEASAILDRAGLHDLAAAVRTAL